MSFDLKKDEGVEGKEKKENVNKGNNGNKKMDKRNQDLDVEKIPADRIKLDN